MKWRHYVQNNFVIHEEQEFWTHGKAVPEWCHNGNDGVGLLLWSRTSVMSHAKRTWQKRHRSVVRIVWRSLNVGNIFCSTCAITPIQRAIEASVKNQSRFSVSARSVLLSLQVHECEFEKLSLVSPCKSKEDSCENLAFSTYCVVSNGTQGTFETLQSVLRIVGCPRAPCWLRKLAASTRRQLLISIYRRKSWSSDVRSGSYSFQSRYCRKKNFSAKR